MHLSVGLGERSCLAAARQRVNKTAINLVQLLLIAAV